VAGVVIEAVAVVMVSPRAVRSRSGWMLFVWSVVEAEATDHHQLLGAGE